MVLDVGMEYVKTMPEIAAAVAKPMEGIDNMTIYEGGTSTLTGAVTAGMKQVQDGFQGCRLAVAFNNKFSKEKNYVNVITADDKEEMKRFRDFLAEQKITNVASESYTRDWERKTLTITAYAETKKS